MESTDSSGGPLPQQQQPNLPPGFRFHPTDEELVVHYLKRKAASAPLPVAIIAEVDLYKFDPWELPAKAAFGEQEWYFFSPRDRKYPNGARPNRAATSGYWKATGTDKPILAAGGTQKVGVKKALVFYGGKPPKGVKTNWIMHEYRLAENKASNRPPPGCDFGNKKNSLRLDDWVLCRIYKKNSTARHMDNDKDEMMEDIFGAARHIPPSISLTAAGVGCHGGISRLSSIFPAKNSTAYGLFSDNNDPSLYDRAVVMNNITTAGNDNNNINNNNNVGLNLASSSGAKPELPMMMMSSLKRALPAPYWPSAVEEEAAAGDGSPSKRFHGDCTPNISSLLSQTPPPLVQQPPAAAVMLGDGMLRTSYQLPGLNWYS